MKSTGNFKNKKTIFTTLICFAFAFAVYGQQNYAKLADSLRYVTEVPYIGNCGDPVFGEIVRKGKAIVPDLINKLTDTEVLKEMYVPVTGGEYTVADVAYIAIREIIAGIPTFELLGIPDDLWCGYCAYWSYMRESGKNRENFQKAVREWYEAYKDGLMWVEDMRSITGECFSPAGGHYALQRKDGIQDTVVVLENK
jgi:hypothetical protein